ncbi:MAG TPA: phenylpyruvate tautomerase MIF-related protein [Methylococcaceae bacterium]|jgi:phenylpyruvate tautomerase|nr:phenylpyruvate tautomerase MIF-related protein [Methylococcaceae bacterium]
MPYLKIQINREVVPEKSKQVLALASRKTAKELSKPESYVMVEITSNPAMLFAGTDEPAAYLELKSIGLPTVLIRPLSKMLCGLLEEQLGIDPARIYIEFTDVKGSCWGWNGSTF